MEHQRSYLESLIEKGIMYAHPNTVLSAYLPKNKPRGKTIVIGAGKASAEMAGAIYKALDFPVSGAVVTRYNHGENIDTGPIKILYANHPIPDDNSVKASSEILSIVNSAQQDDRVICLISGGGSALLTAPANDITLDEIKEITDILVKSGAPITDINCVRRHLSAVKGGRLFKAAMPAEVITLAISDVVGDHPEDIASGPTVASLFEPERAITILEETGYDVPDHIRLAVLENEVPRSFQSDFRIIAKASSALDAIEKQLSEDGWIVHHLGYDLTGDASETGYSHAAEINHLKDNSGKHAFLSGGELTVDVKNPNGDGGPNLEYLSALLISLQMGLNYEAIACDSDGIDGSKDNAGGYISSLTLDKCAKLSLNAKSTLEENNSYALFSSLDQLVVTGPTGTNVNDIRIILVDKNCEVAA